LFRVVLLDPLSQSDLILQRLKSRPQFQAVLAGATLARTPHFALHRVALDAAGAQAPQATLFAVADVWLGAMVPKRWAKRAVTRNTIKRQVYAVSQDFAHSLACAAHVVRLRSGFDRQHFVSASSPALKAAVRDELLQLFNKATATPASAGLKTA
jgi:ribonuclease P protein component